ncbi:MAG TPA: signal peptidase I [Candidatus Limnocylindrales bacterium]|nr:signal peptidase I [Candidatus Limnocylindrales bacterium]
MRSGRDSPKRQSLALQMLTSGFAALGILFALAFPLGWLRTVRVSSINMAPTLVPDDRVMVRSYGGEPRPGDVVVYRSPLGDSLLVARVVAVAGETIEMDTGGLLLDGCPVAVPTGATPAAEVDDGTCSIESDRCASHAGCRTPTCAEGSGVAASRGEAHAAQSEDDAKAETDAEAETNPLVVTEAVGSHCYFTRTAGAFSSLFFERRGVPAGHVFVLNDNRVDERDSRIYGAIPLEAVVGVASFVYYASDESGIRWDRINRRVS